MRRTTWVILIMAALTPAGGHAQQLDSARVRRITEAVEDYMRSGHIPGMSVAVSRGHGISFAAGFGYADLENRVPADSMTAFPTASVLKVITATAVMQLAEKQRLDLDRPIQTYCPAFPEKRWPVTARRLLAHQAGIRPSRGSAVFNREHFVTVNDAVKAFAGDSLLFEPGTATAYSNEGYVLLACAIEGASGQSYDRYLEDNLLRPLGMVRTFPDKVYQVMPGIARSYLVRTDENTKNWKGLWTPAELAETAVDVPAVAEQVDLSIFPGAGNYRSTPADILRFVAALKGRLLSDSTVRTLFADAPLRNGTPTGRTPGDWLLADLGGIPSMRVLGSVWTGSFGVWTIPSSGVTVAVASNVQFNQPDGLMRRILEILTLP